MDLLLIRTDRLWVAERPNLRAAIHTWVHVQAEPTILGMDDAQSTEVIITRFFVKTSLKYL